MNRAELRRLLTVVLPAGLAVAIVAFVVASALDDEAIIAPTGTGGDVSTSVAPFIGEDHWHASYEYIVCGELQPPAPTWEGGIHTHGDGIIHIHPFSQYEEGSGARLVKWFEYGGGVLEPERVRLPGDSRTYEQGDQCPDGSSGVVQVFVNGEREDDFMRYIPSDGDRISIVFGPERNVVSAPLTGPAARLY